MENEILEIAAEVLGMETQETRNADHLDFHELSVWQIRQALIRAYNAGHNAGASAVPELLQVSKLALAEAESCIRSEFQGTSYFDGYMENLQPIRDAIAKAEGK